MKVVTPQPRASSSMYYASAEFNQGCPSKTPCKLHSREGREGGVRRREMEKGRGGCQHHGQFRRDLRWCPRRESCRFVTVTNVAPADQDTVIVRGKQWVDPYVAVLYIQKPTGVILPMAPIGSFLSFSLDFIFLARLHLFMIHQRFMSAGRLAL